MIKLLYITNGITGAGGLERVLSIKASYLADKMDYEVHILSLNHNNAHLFYELSPKLILHNVKVGGNPLRYFLRYYNGIKKVVNEINPDIISVCDDGLKGFFLPILLRKPCPMIYERHASVNLNFKRKKSIYTFHFKKFIAHKLMNFGGKTFDSFVVLTKGNLKEWNTENEKVIPNPVSFNLDKASNLSSKKVIAVGSHSFNKGYDLLIDAWKIVAMEKPDWQINIYGKIDEKSTFVEMAKNMNVTSSMFFFDPVPNIHEKYLESSIMVLPSRSEGFGMVLIEAMASGVPCVSFDCPHGPADIITDGEDGFLVENGNIQELADKIIELIEDESLRKQMGQKAQQNVKRYHPDIIVQKWDKLFKSLLNLEND